MNLVTILLILLIIGALGGSGLGWYPAHYGIGGGGLLVVILIVILVFGIGRG